MERVLVVGCPGSGKSTLARRLAAEQGLPLIELDRAFWRPGWVETPREEWLAQVGQFSAAPRWVMDGNYGNSLRIRLPRADTVLWLDYPRLRCVRRAVMRSAKHHGRVREGGPDGCPERFNMEFLRYIWNFPGRSRPRLVDALERFGARATIHILKSDADGERLLGALRAGRGLNQHAGPLNASLPQPPIPRSAAPSRD